MHEGNKSPIYLGNSLASLVIMNIISAYFALVKHNIKCLLEMHISGGESILIHKLFKTLQKRFVLAETAQNQPPNCNGLVHVYQHKHSVSTLPRAAVQTMNVATSVLRTEPHIELPIRLHTATWYLTKIDPTSSSSFSYIKSLNCYKCHFKHPVVQTD